ncbi:unnamed protein product [Lactuca saligna]|uniref:Uncharacterized protein n=1 Tax=Lactuca saligna TaxID=75948 RepID=A0AA35YMG4_LACSI|nr:unnamed protein product [Lactuca saligna]
MDFDRLQVEVAFPVFGRTEGRDMTKAEGSLSFPSGYSMRAKIRSEETEVDWSEEASRAAISVKMIPSEERKQIINMISGCLFVLTGIYGMNKMVGWLLMFDKKRRRLSVIEKGVWLFVVYAKGKENEARKKNVMFFLMFAGIQKSKNKMVLR